MLKNGGRSSRSLKSSRSEPTADQHWALYCLQPDPEANEQCITWYRKRPTVSTMRPRLRSAANMPAR